MTAKTYTLAVLLSSTGLFAQETTPDTTRVNMGKMEILLVDHSSETEEAEVDTIDASPDENEKKVFKGHWSGIDVGINMVMDEKFERNFENYPYWETDITKSSVWNFNILEHKFKIYKNYIGITTGFGFNLNAFHFTENYMIKSNSDSTFAKLDTVYNYAKNKLQANYFTVPLLLEFCSSNNDDNTFYLAAGVVGGVRISSKSVTVTEIEGKKERLVRKDGFGINPFKLDAALRMGYGTWGFFANYSLIPFFEKGKTLELYPLTCGVTCNF
jgi:hypothetical protein